VGQGQGTTACAGVTIFFAWPGGILFDAPCPLPCASAGALSARTAVIVNSGKRKRAMDTRASI